MLDSEIWEMENKFHPINRILAPFLLIMGFAIPANREIEVEILFCMLWEILRYGKLKPNTLYCYKIHLYFEKEELLKKAYKKLYSGKKLNLIECINWGFED